MSVKSAIGLSYLSITRPARSAMPHSSRTGAAARSTVVFMHSCIEYFDVECRQLDSEWYVLTIIRSKSNTAGFSFIIFAKLSVPDSAMLLNRFRVQNISPKISDANKRKLCYWLAVPVLPLYQVLRLSLFRHTHKSNHSHITSTKILMAV